MKLSSKLLTGLGIAVIAALVAANISIKKSYDDMDKDDPYWQYGTILAQPFSHIHITGGNVCEITVQQAAKPAVLVLKQWPGYESGAVKAFVNKDTLFLGFPNESANTANVREWMEHEKLVRIFTPIITSIDGADTKLELLNFHQTALTLRLSGKSTAELENPLSNFDSLNIVENDSSLAYFTITPNQKTNQNALQVQSADISLHGASRLDLTPVNVSSLKLNISDTSIIQLSGYNLKSAVR